METLDINKDSGTVTYEYAVDGMGIKCVAPLKYWPAFKKIYDLEVIDDDVSRLNPNSYNIRLGSTLLVYDEPILDMKKYPDFHRIEIPEEGLVLSPNKLYLGKTMEHTETKGFVPMLEGRSSIGRLGLCIHVTAGFGDNGFKGQWTLEMHCIESIRIYAGIEVGQIYYHTIEGETDMQYTSGKYQENRGVQPSKLYQDFLAV